MTDDELLAEVLRAIRARGYVPPSPERDQEMGVLYRAGVHLWDIQRAFGLGADTVKAALRRANLMPPPKKQARRRQSEMQIVTRTGSVVWVVGVTRRNGQTLEVRRGGAFDGADVWTPERVWRETNNPLDTP